MLFFTSGSTGRPKGVVLSHRANYLRGFQGVFRDVPERSVCMFPLFHMAGFTLAIAAWQTRGEIALVTSATAEELLAAVERRRANRLYAIPAVWARILEADTRKWNTHEPARGRHGHVGGADRARARAQGALPEHRDADLLRLHRSGLGRDAARRRRAPEAGQRRAASPGVDLRLAGDGEILLRSAYLFDGYFDDPEASAAALRDGWFHTGDLGELDADGYLHVIGRKKELIRTGGESVAPAEVEAVLATHPDVAEVAVIGLPDPTWGEVVCAVVVARRGGAPTLEALQAHAEGRLAAFKKPRRLECVAALPRTAATGQVQRALLVEQITSR